MKIVLCGSGSGGHITPLLAVAAEIKKQDPKTEVIYIGEKNGKYTDLTNSPVFDKRFFIYSGKFRRYHGESWLVRLFDLKTNTLNLRDFFRIITGVVQGSRLFRKLDADVVMLKGGSVCLAAGLGARLAKVPTITHDSDALPGVSNRVGGRHAILHTTAMPVEFYKYDKSKTLEVGLPINDNFREYSDDEKRFLKEKFNISAGDKIVLITGGSGGATRLNRWGEQVAKELLAKTKDITFIFVTGHNKSLSLKNPKIIEMEFTDEMFHLSAIADVVICRAGATTLAEYAKQSKAVICIPSPDLTGGHQVKNAKVYQSSQAIIMIEEKDLNNGVSKLVTEIQNILGDRDLRRRLGDNLYKSLPAQPAAVKLAEILISIARGESV